MIEYTKYGTIRGGVCEKAHKTRFAREKGARMYWNRLEKAGAIKWRYGWGRIVKIPRITEKEIYGVGARLGASYEIGWRRFSNDIIAILYRSGKAFRQTWIDKWLEGVCSFEFPSGKIHQGAIYDAKKTAGELSGGRK